MSTPYWGELPPPKVARQQSGRRRDSRGDDPSIETYPNSDRYSGERQYQSKANRASIQTEATSNSPFISPVASSFNPDGLAPRPTSYAYPPNDRSVDNEYAEKRRRRQSRTKDQYSDPSQMPPAAPDVPRNAPPLSYKTAHGEEPVNQGPGPSKSTRRSDGSTASVGVPEDYYRTRNDPSLEQGVLRSKGGSTKRSSKGGGYERSRDGRERINSFKPPGRQGSYADADPQAELASATEKSPLQRLERTLTSITKEEKRARMEEAELRAKEGTPATGSEKPIKNSVSFKRRPLEQPHSTEVQPEPILINEEELEEAPVEELSAATLSNKARKGKAVDNGEISKSAVPVTNEMDRHLEREREEEMEPPRASVEAQAPIAATKRVPSVRERSRIPVPAARSNSKKIRKDPPEAHWLGRPPTLEEPTISSTSPASRPSQSAPNSKRVVEDLYIPDEPAPTGDGEASPVSPLSSLGDLDPYDTPVRRNSTRKVEQLTGQKGIHQGVRPQEQARQQIQRRAVPERQAQPEQPRYANDRNMAGDDVMVTVNGRKYPVPAVSVGNRAPRDMPIQKDAANRHRVSNFVHHGRHSSATRAGYVAGNRLDEWKKGGVALLAGGLLNLDQIPQNQEKLDKNKAWWENDASGRQRNNSTSKPLKAEAYDGELDDNTAPTRFKPALFLKCGPLLRYCGLRQEFNNKIPASRGGPKEREVWRGSVMIVTDDSRSSYELAPTLRLFLQPAELLPPPPSQVDGVYEPLAPEYVDPIAGLPKVGRDGRTLYVRPVEHLDVETDLSREESDAGLFELLKSPLDEPHPGMDGAKRSKDATSTSMHPPKKPVLVDGEKLGKYKEVRGFRLHTERGVTFWRFNIEVELSDTQQRMAYRINRGPATAFWVPARNQPMNIMFHSCNGFSLSVKPDDFSGPDPLWRDVLNTHQTQPFHVMIGGGDQVYNDAVMDQTTLFKEWLDIRNPLNKENAPLTPELQDELETFYLNRYCMWFSQGLFGLANSQIPMVNIYDDHDIIDGFGSYPDHYMRSPVMSGLGAVAFKYYMLFQHQSSIDEGEEHEPSWLLGTRPGPYIPELSRSIFTHLGRSVAFLGLDCRTERMHDEVVSAETYHKVFDRLEKELVKGETKHLIVLLGVPIAYPRMVWLENILTSRLLDPVKALSRAGLFGKGLLNRFDGGVEVLDDLDDHWTARHHKEERNWFIEELQDLAAEKSVRVTILGGDVHLAAIGQFYSNPKLGIPKHHDHRYMPNIISSAIVNTPPPDMLADVLNRRNKVHHLDHNTDEDMIPIFAHDVNGKARNNKRLLNRRNWCSIRPYNPDLTPPPTPPSPFGGEQEVSLKPSISKPPPKAGFFRRLSIGRRQDGLTYSTPPLSNPGFFNRRPLTARRDSSESERPGSSLKRTSSLSRRDFMPALFRRNSKKKQNSGGINGYGSESEDDRYQDNGRYQDDGQYQDNNRYQDNNQYQNNSRYSDDIPHQDSRHRVGLRGGSGGDDNEGYFSQQVHSQPPPPHSIQGASTSVAGGTPQVGPPNRFHRTPTGLTTKQLRKPRGAAVNLEGGLDICLNVEISQKDPAGITMPYRLLVPALWCEDLGPGFHDNRVQEKAKRWAMFGRRKREINVEK